VTDLERFLALLAELREALRVLGRYRATVPRERLMAEIDTQNMVLFALYRAVQCSIDLGQHVIAERELPVPSAYREVFRVLGSAGIVDATLAEHLERWGGFRNVVAHQYGSLDLERVARALYEDLDDLEDFATAMARLAPPPRSE
jgi:uncharacterized protein YutE (UPF0331/DUF86 family)